MLIFLWKWARRGRYSQLRSFTKIEEENIRTFGFNRTALRATQPKLHSMFRALFLKIALSAAELISFGNLGAAIWHLWTIICGVHTIDNVLKNLTHREGYYLASRGLKSFSIIHRKDWLSNKEGNLRKYSVVILRHFPKKKSYLVDLV